jgi:hypothetical protein
MPAIAALQLRTQLIGSGSCKRKGRHAPTGSSRIVLTGIPACKILPRSEATHRSVVAQLRRPDQVVDEGVVVRYALPAALRDRQWRRNLR